MIAGHALRVLAAVEFGARIDTLSIESVAVLVRRTVLIVLANTLAFIHCKCKRYVD